MLRVRGIGVDLDQTNSLFPAPLRSPGPIPRIELGDERVEQMG